MSCAKTAEPIEMPFGLWTQVGQRSIIKWGIDPPSEGQLLGERACPTTLCMSCAKMAELIDLPFGLWTLVGLKEAQVHSYSLGSANVPLMGGTLATSDEYDFIRLSAAAMWPYVTLL